MADLTFKLYDLDDNEIKPRAVLSYELSRDADAACDGLRLNLLLDEAGAELYTVKAFYGKVCAFNGYVDTQRESINTDGSTCFLYCRSSACLLVDSEAKPFTYNSPSVNALFEIGIGDGFRLCMDNVFSDIQYQVSKGTSKFGLLNDFVFNVTGNRIRVNPKNEIVMLKSERVIKIDRDGILSVKREINRGNAVMGVDYKLNSSDDYLYHRVSRFMQKKRISATRMLNMSNVPDWQRETRLSSFVSNANAGYCCWELKLSGYADIDLADIIRTDLDGFDDYGDVVAVGIRHTCNASGEYTVIKAYSALDLEELSYVDE